MPPRESEEAFCFIGYFVLNMSPKSQPLVPHLFQLPVSHKGH